MSQNASEDPAPWAAFVPQWKSLRISPEQPEQAIREQILAPMLTMLGYGLRTMNEILYVPGDNYPDRSASIILAGGSGCSGIRSGLSHGEGMSSFPFVLL